MESISRLCEKKLKHFGMLFNRGSMELTMSQSRIVFTAFIKLLDHANTLIRRVREN